MDGLSLTFFIGLLLIIAFYFYPFNISTKSADTPNNQSIQSDEKHKNKKKRKTSEHSSSASSTKPNSNTNNHSTVNNNSNEKDKDKKNSSDSTSSSLIRHLRGHQNDVIQSVWAQNGLIVSVSRDESVRVWDSSVKNFFTKNQNDLLVPFGRLSVPGLFASSIGVSNEPDSHSSHSAFIVFASTDKIIYHTHVARRMNDSGVFKYEFSELKMFKSEPNADIITHIGVGQRLSFIACMMQGQDTRILVYSSAGGLLHTLKTSQLINNDMKMSLDGRFISVATKMSDTRIWEFKLKSGALEKPAHVMTTKGLNKGVSCLDFGNDILVTCGFDLLINVWDISIRYQAGADPKRIFYFPFQQEVPIQAIAVSPLVTANMIMKANNNDSGDKDGELEVKGVFAVLSSNGHLFTFSLQGQLVDSFVCNKGQGKNICFSANGNFLISSGGTDRSISLWHIK